MHIYVYHYYTIFIWLSRDALKHMNVIYYNMHNYISIAFP